MRIAVSATGKFRRLIDNPKFSQSKKLLSFKDFCGKLPNLKDIIEEEEEEDEDEWLKIIYNLLFNAWLI